MLTAESDAIKARFFSALDEIVSRKLIRGKKTFANRYGINRGNLHQIQKTPAYHLPVGYLTPLVRDFGISSQWLLTGEGEMFSKRFTTTTKQPAPKEQAV